MKLQKFIQNHYSHAKTNRKGLPARMKDSCLGMLSYLKARFERTTKLDIVDRQCVLTLGDKRQSISFMCPEEIDGLPLNLLFTVGFETDSYSMSLVCQLLNRDCTRLELLTNDLTLVLIRYFNGLNSAPSPNVIYLHTNTKVIMVRHTNSSTIKEYEQMLINTEETARYVLNQIAEIRSKLTNALTHILFLCNLRPDPRDHAKAKAPESIRASIIRDISLEIRTVRSTNSLRQPTQLELPKEAASALSGVAKYLSASQTSFASPADAQSQSLASEERVKFFQHPRARLANNIDRSEILSRVQFRQQQVRWDSFDETKFSKIYVGTVYMNYVLPNETQSEQLTKLMVKKERVKSATESRNRIEQEYLILKRIQSCQCININRYYYRERTKHDEIFSEFCGFRSLDKYKESYQQTMSILTKIFLLCHIVQGMRFLRDKLIIHCDIKAGNVLLSRNLTAKLCDFGDSIVAGPSGFGESISTSLTPFFSPPEVYGRDIHPHSKLDVYSLGVLMFEMLFNRYPYELSLGSSFQYHINRKNIDFSELHKIQAERIMGYGPRELLECIAQLCLLCFSKDPLLRPGLDNILVVLRLSMNYLTKLF